MEIGYAKGEFCNREGCKGIIDEYPKEGGCSCHINTPCSYCTEETGYCPKCGWDAKEEYFLSSVILPPPNFVCSLATVYYQNAKAAQKIKPTACFLLQFTLIFISLIILYKIFSKGASHAG